MASTACSFVGAPAALRNPATTRRGSSMARHASITRAEVSASSTVTVTPSTVAVRSGSASVKGTVRKQNEDRFASYVSIHQPSRPPPPFFT